LSASLNSAIGQRIRRTKASKSGRASGTVKAGQEVVASVEGFGGATVKGAIDFVYPQMRTHHEQLCFKLEASFTL